MQNNLKRSKHLGKYVSSAVLLFVYYYYFHSFGALSLRLETQMIYAFIQEVSFLRM